MPSAITAAGPGVAANGSRKLQVTLRASAQEFELIESVAERLDLPVATMFRQAIRRFLLNHPDLDLTPEQDALLQAMASNRRVTASSRASLAGATPNGKGEG